MRTLMDRKIAWAWLGSYKLLHQLKYINKNNYIIAIN